MTSSIGLSAHSRALEGAVDAVDVGLVVLVVMDPHRLLVDVRLQRRVVVGQRRNGVRHAVSSDGWRVTWAFLRTRVAKLRNPGDVTAEVDRLNRMCKSKWAYETRDSRRGRSLPRGQRVRTYTRRQGCRRRRPGRPTRREWVFGLLGKPRYRRRLEQLEALDLRRRPGCEPCLRALVTDEWTPDALHHVGWCESCRAAAHRAR